MFDLDLKEHVKILFVAIFAAAVVVTVGLHAETQPAPASGYKIDGMNLRVPAQEQFKPAAPASRIRVAQHSSFHE